MRGDLTDVTILLDRSGSMQSIREDTIGGVNAFLADQRKVPGECLVSISQFDNLFESVYVAKRLDEAADLTKETFVPRGSTALYDAICRVIDETGRRLQAIPEEERPGLVVVVIVTDGFENASRRHNIHEVNERISTQRDQYKWKFVFLGANQDAIATGEKLGVQSGLIMTYAASGKGTRAAYAAVSTNLAEARVNAMSGQSVSMGFSNEQREEQDSEIKQIGSGR